MTAAAVAALLAGNAHAQSLGGGTVQVKAGVATPIYGVRGDDCVHPPTFGELNLAAIPAGTYSDGGIGERGSNSCKKRVPVRLVNFTSAAGYTGTVTVTIDGDDITLVIR